MQPVTFDHNTIKVRNLEESVRFYSTILGLQQIENRTQKEHIRWFSIGKDNELHIVEGATEFTSDIGVHIAFRLAWFDQFLNHLREHKITPHNSGGIRDSITTRADGVRQVYFQDPDGYWIEVNEAGT